MTDASLPTVLLNCPPVGLPFDSINVDNHGGAMAMVRHLAGLGHRRIAFIQGSPDNHDARERLRGYRDAVRELGLEADRKLEVAGDFSEEAGCRAGERLLGLKDGPDAVFAANDAMAIGCLHALRQASVAVPEEIAEYEKASSAVITAVTKSILQRQFDRRAAQAFRATGSAGGR